MSSGRFLVSLNEVLNTERIETCRSLLKENINFEEEGLKRVQKNDNFILLEMFARHGSEIHELSLSINSKEMVYTISGYITKKLNDFYVKCVPCSW